MALGVTIKFDMETRLFWAQSLYRQDALIMSEFETAVVVGIRSIKRPNSYEMLIIADHICPPDMTIPLIGTRGSAVPQRGDGALLHVPNSGPPVAVRLFGPPVLSSPLVSLADVRADGINDNAPHIPLDEGLRTGLN